jgi:hypothetical protein
MNRLLVYLGVTASQLSVGSFIFCSNMSNIKESPVYENNNRIYARLTVISAYKGIIYGAIPIIPIVFISLDLFSPDKTMFDRHFIPCSVYGNYKRMQ